jgi:hypothetical protein
VALGERYINMTAWHGHASILLRQQWLLTQLMAQHARIWQLMVGCVLRRVVMSDI